MILLLFIISLTNIIIMSHFETKYFDIFDRIEKKNIYNFLEKHELLKHLELIKLFQKSSSSS